MPTTICSIDGCDQPLHSRTWCQKHYARWWRHGNVQLKRPPTSEILRVPLRCVDPDKRAMAAAGQIVFDTLIARLR